MCSAFLKVEKLIKMKKIPYIPIIIRRLFPNEKFQFSVMIFPRKYASTTAIILRIIGQIGGREIYFRDEYSVSK